jgi:aspartate 1-decarboxylase
MPRLTGTAPKANRSPRFPDSTAAQDRPFHADLAPQAPHHYDEVWRTGTVGTGTGEQGRLFASRQQGVSWSVWDMQIQILKSKIHRARVTQSELNYIGSITLDAELIEAADLIPGEKVQIVNNNNGERFETYVIEGERESGVVCLNGAAARKVQVGDILIIISYGLIDKSAARSYRPIVVFPDDRNRVTDRSRQISTYELKGPVPG